LSNQSFTASQSVAIINYADAATVALDLSQGNTFFGQIAGNRSFTFSNPKDGQMVFLYIQQDSTGSRIPNFPASVHWANNTTPTFTTTALRRDLVQLQYNAALGIYFASAILNFAP
jgi:hypothetical protein